MSDATCLVCAAPEWGNVCPTCGAQGWTDKTVLAAIVRALAERADV